MRRRLPELEGELREHRPDILGIVRAWHDDGSFTQAVYFTSQQAARQAEKATEQSELRQQFMSLMDGQPVFFDLAKPDLD
jgi:hypothetical protein